MAIIARVPVEWSGLPNLPGYSVFHWDFTVNPDLSDLTAFFTAVAGRFITGLTWRIPSAGDTINDADGSLAGSWVATGGGSVVSSAGAGQYAAGTGVRVRWETGTIVGKRRLKGATYMLPIAGAGYDNDGTITSTYLTTFQNAANTLVSAGGLLVWHRNTPGGSDGTSAAVVSAVVPDRVSSLRTRRT